MWQAFTKAFYRQNRVTLALFSYIAEGSISKKDITIEPLIEHHKQKLNAFRDLPLHVRAHT